MIADPDKDILDRLDRRERRAELLAAAKGVAGGLIAALAGLEIMLHGLGWNGRASGDGAAVIFIACGMALFLKLSKPRA